MDSLQKPNGVKQAEIAVWGMLAVSALVELINKWSGAISGDDFAGRLFFYGLICIIPYKIGRGSNPARYFYTIVTAISVLFMLGVGNFGTRLDWVVSVLMLPIESFVIYRLFQRDASEWFSQVR